MNDLCLRAELRLCLSWFLVVTLSRELAGSKHLFARSRIVATAFLSCLVPWIKVDLTSRWILLQCWWFYWLWALWVLPREKRGSCSLLHDRQPSASWTSFGVVHNTQESRTALWIGATYVRLFSVHSAFFWIPFLRFFFFPSLDTVPPLPHFIPIHNR